MLSPKWTLWHLSLILSGVCIVTFIVTIAILLFLYRKQLVTTDELRAKVMAMDERQEIKRFYIA